MRQFIGAASLLMMTACGQPGVGANAKGTAAAGLAAATTAVASHKWDAEAACSLLATSTISAVLGIDVVKVMPGPITQATDRTAGSSVCYYDLVGGRRLTFMARQFPGPDNTIEAMQRARIEITQVVGTVEDVGEIGKSAFWVPKLRQLAVFLGEDRYFTLTMPRAVGDQDPKALALRLAARIG